MTDPASIRAAVDTVVAKADRIGSRRLFRHRGRRALSLSLHMRRCTATRPQTLWSTTLVTASLGRSLRRTWPPCTSSLRRTSTAPWPSARFAARNCLAGERRRHANISAGLPHPLFARSHYPGGRSVHDSAGRRQAGQHWQHQRRHADALLRFGPRRAREDQPRALRDLSSSPLVAVPCFCLGAYAATKAALHAMSDCMRMELKPFSVDVVVVMPGYASSAR